MRNVKPATISIKEFMGKSCPEMIRKMCENAETERVSAPKVTAQTAPVQTFQSTWRDYISYTLEKYITGKMHCDPAISNIVSICRKYGLTLIENKLKRLLSTYGKECALRYMARDYVTNMA